MAVFLDRQFKCNKNDFNEWVIGSLQAPPYHCYCHVLPQWAFIESGGVRFCKHILPMEDLEATFNDLMTILGLDMWFPPDVKINCGMSCRSLRLRSIPPHELYNATSIAALRAHFAIDFLYLGDFFANFSMVEHELFVAGLLGECGHPLLAVMWRVCR